MPYGPQPGDPAKVSAGTLELLGQREIVPRNSELDLPDDRIASEEVWAQGGEAMEDAVDAVRGGVRIVIMNPPFTNRAKMGEKFPQATQQALRSRVDDMERILVRSDADMNDFVDKNSLAPLFVALADKCLSTSNSTLTMVHPTVALTNPSGRQERAILAQRYHIHTVLTCHQPGQINMSQNTSINESIIVARGYEGERPPTRLSTWTGSRPTTLRRQTCTNVLWAVTKAQSLTDGARYRTGPQSASRPETWTPAIWRSPELAQVAYAYAGREGMQSVEQEDIYQAGRRVSEFCKRPEKTTKTALLYFTRKGRTARLR